MFISVDKDDFWEAVKEANFCVCDYSGYKRISFHGYEECRSRRDGGGFFEEEEEIITIPSILAECFFKNDDRFLMEFPVSTEYSYELQFSGKKLIGATMLYDCEEFPLLSLCFFDYSDN